MRKFNADGSSRIRLSTPPTSDGYYAVGKFRKGKKGEKEAKKLADEHGRYRQRMGFVEGTRARLSGRTWYVESKLMVPLPPNATWSIEEQKWIEGTR